MAVKIYCGLYSIKQDGSGEIRPYLLGAKCYSPFIDFGIEDEWLNNPDECKSHANKAWAYVEILWDDETNLEVMS